MILSGHKEAIGEQNGLAVELEMGIVAPKSSSANPTLLAVCTSWRECRLWMGEGNKRVCLNK